MASYSQYKNLTGYEKNSLESYTRDEVRGIAINYGIPLSRIIKEKINKAELIDQIRNNSNYIKANPELKSIHQYDDLTGYEQPLEEYNRDQLRSIASRLGITGYSRYVKDKLTDLIKNNPIFKRNKPDKVTILQKRLAGIKDVDLMMKIIMEVFSDTTKVPIPGEAFTFIYKAKTPGIEYDMHPLIIVDSIIGKWGFRGFNIHWNKYRNYTWPEVKSSFHIVKKGKEFDYLATVPYMKRLRN